MGSDHRSREVTLLLYDSTRASILNTLEEWAKICRAFDPNLPILLIGAKVDLIERQAVPLNIAREYNTSMELLDYMEVSAKDGENME